MYYVSCQSTDHPSCRKSANDSILLTYEKKTQNKNDQVHTNEEDLLNNNVLLHEESAEPSPISLEIKYEVK